MNATLSRLAHPTARAFAAFAAALALASCGGGSVGPSPVVPDQQAIVILPASSATAPVLAYSGMPTTFSITGGNGSYIVASNNQAVIASPGAFTGSSFSIVPSPVLAETTVTLSVRDTATAPPVTATIAVRPGTINNSITIAPSSTQAADCSPAICSGGDAEVRVTLSQGGIPLPARGVRFEVVSGSFSFITSAPGLPEQVAASHVAVTDETGVARARMRVAAGAANQTALLQVTDLGTGAFRQTSFAIAQYNGNTPAFFTLPSSITLTGANTDRCSNGTAEVAVFGGTPPYSVVGASTAFSVTPSSIASSGGKFTVSFVSTFQCIENLPVAVTDATGRTLTVLVTNRLGTSAPPISVAPTSLTLGCSTDTAAATTSVVVSGGSTPISASSNHPRVSVTVASRTVSVRRLGNDGTTVYPTTAVITITDGATSAEVTATVPANCPGGTSGGLLAADPSSVVLTAANYAFGVNVFLSGGSGTYSVAFISDPKVAASVAGASLRIHDTTSGICTNPPINAFVKISDGTSTLDIPVTGNTCN